MKLTEKRPLIISGPCSAETREQTLDTCRAIAASGRVDMIRAGIWKPRTAPGGFEGSGLKGLAWISEAKAETGLPVAVEVATAAHVQSALEFGVDVLWIGARTTVNPFSVQEIADALRGVDVPVMVKNPMNPDVKLWAGAIERLRKVGVKDLGLIHRGFSSYGASEYRNAPMWHLAIEMKMLMPDVPMICDPSHICGNTHLLHSVCQQAADLRYDGLIIESHCTPKEAWSDAAQQVTPDELIKLIDSVVWRNETDTRPEFQQQLERLRSQIDQYDAELFKILSRRMQVAEQIGRTKRENNVMILQTARWDEIVSKFIAQSEGLDLSKEFLSILLNSIHMESIQRQNRVMNE